MLWYMNSKTMDLFLNNESDDDILEAQYIIVSNRIRRLGTSHTNIVQANVLFPNSYTMNSVDDKEFERKYYEQLDENKTLIALLIRTVIIQGFNIIFICSKNEDKLGHYLRLISNYVYTEFGIPMYSYKDFANGYIKEQPYDSSKVYAKCKKVIDAAKENEIIEKIKNERKLSKKDKKILKKLLKKHNLYDKGMTSYEMRNIAYTILGEEGLYEED